MREYAIVCAVMRRGGDLLMVRQAGPGETPVWTIPGGQIEAGEDVVDALVREVGEETGLTVLDPGCLAFVSEADDPRAGWSASVSTWDVASWSGEVQPRDPDCYVLEAAWKPLEEAVELLSRIAWHPLTVRYLRGELEAGSRCRGRVGGEWSALEPWRTPRGNVAGAMRIVAGERKGHRILAPKGADTRPTSDRVREAAFNLIGPVDGATVLDLYAGSGAMGLEALSRGAARAVFVEARADAARTIERNLDRIRLTAAEVVRRDALGALAADAAAGRTYDLVLVDPPYAEWESLQPRLAVYLPSVLAPDGVLVVETAARVEPELPLALRTSRRYGSARLTLFGLP